MYLQPPVCTEDANNKWIIMAAEQDTSADSFLPTGDYYVRELVKSKNFHKIA
jgi:hypothetical protein